MPNPARAGLTGALSRPSEPSDPSWDHLAKVTLAGGRRALFARLPHVSSHCPLVPRPRGRRTREDDRASTRALAFATVERAPPSVRRGGGDHSDSLGSGNAGIRQSPSTGRSVRFRTRHTPCTVCVQARGESDVDRVGRRHAGVMCLEPPSTLRRRAGPHVEPSSRARVSVQPPPVRTDAFCGAPGSRLTEIRSAVATRLGEKAHRRAVGTAQDEALAAGRAFRPRSSARLHASQRPSGPSSGSASAQPEKSAVSPGAGPSGDNYWPRASGTPAQSSRPLPTFGRPPVGRPPAGGVSTRWYFSWGCIEAWLV